jgi:hypothetical protein
MGNMPTPWRYDFPIRCAPQSSRLPRTPIFRFEFGDAENRASALHLTAIICRHPPGSPSAAKMRHKRSCAEIFHLTSASPNPLILLASIFDAKVLIYARARPRELGRNQMG